MAGVLQRDHKEEMRALTDDDTCPAYIPVTRARHTPKIRMSVIICQRAGSMSQVPSDYSDAPMSKVVQVRLFSRSVLHALATGIAAGLDKTVAACTIKP